MILTTVSCNGRVEVSITSKRFAQICGSRLTDEAEKTGSSAMVNPLMSASVPGRSSKP